MFKTRKTQIKQKRDKKPTKKSVLPQWKARNFWKGEYSVPRREKKVLISDENLNGA